MSLPQFLYAQKEGNNWYFGNNAGITFNSNPPTAITNGKMTAIEGCAAISTNQGRLLFYTDGKSVWDSTHTKTPNGNSTLKGHVSSTQSVIIVPHPDSSGLYYIFTTDQSTGSGGLCYSIFKMSLNAGKGDVMVSRQNIQLLAFSCEKLTAVKHNNGHDYWVMAHHPDSDTLYAFLITSAGLNKIIKNTTGLKINPWSSQTLGYIKVSPDGSKIAYANYSKDTLILADFNSTTGVVSNVFQTFLPYGYGVEFSARSKYLYAIEEKNAMIYQFDASAKSQSDFNTSKLKIDSTKGATLFGGSLQLGTDGKIYINIAINYFYLGVIHAPDSAGKKCRVQQNYIYLKGKSVLYGLPGFITSYFDRNQKIRFTRNCLNDSTRFWPSITQELDSVRWDFGDTSSGYKNTSRSLKNAYHFYSSKGDFKVKLISYFKTYTDTSFVIVPLKNTKPLLGKDTLLCNTFSLKLKPQRDYLNYRWSNGDSLKITTIKKPGTYILSAKDSLNCEVSDTIIVKNSIVSAQFNTMDTALCKNYNSFHFKNRTVLKDDGLKSILWKLSDSSNYSDSVFIKSFKTAGNFIIKLIVSSKNGCTDSVSKNIVVHPNADIGFSINQSYQCFKGHDFIFKDTSKISVGKISRYFWDLGDGKTDTLKTISSKKYSLDSTYKITLITTTDKGCKDTISKMVSVYPNPKSDFSINQAIQCFNHNSYDFKNLSAIRTDSILNYFWDLGDSRSATSKDVSRKIYATSDSFGVRLLAVSKHGCRDSLMKKVLVNANTSVDFSINSPSQCFNRHEFNFKNSSTILRGTFNSKWELGDGDTSASKDIFSKKYSKDSFYTVSLFTTTDKGCKDTLSKTVLVHPNPVAGFKINDPTQCFKWNSFDYTNTSTIKTGSIAENNWNLGDGDKRNAIDIKAKHYGFKDSFNVDLLIVSDKGCRDSIGQRIKIFKMEADFDISIDSTSCPVYTFCNTTKNYKTIKWHLGDLGLDEENNTRYKPVFNHQFSQLGTFTPCLFVENGNGCLDTVCKELKVDVAKKLNIPNVFTPGNNDKLNDAFDIETAGMEEYHLAIYNRWGQKLFETDVDGIRDDGHNWRGRENAVSRLYPDGTYFYILNYKFKCENTAKEVHGIITLIGEKE